MRVPRVGTGPIVPVPEDGNEVRSLVANHAAPALAGSGEPSDQAAIERVPRGPRHGLLRDGFDVARERGNDLVPYLRGDFVRGAVAGRLAPPDSSTDGGRGY